MRRLKREKIAPTLDAGARPKLKLARKHRSAGKATSKYRIAHHPTDESRKMIANMSSYGLDVLMVAKLSGISPPTLYKYYRHELTTSAAKKDLAVLQSAFLKAVGGPEQNWEKADAAQQRWWIGARQGWRPPPDRSINANFNMDLQRLSDRQLDELERIMEAAALEPGRGQAREGFPEPESE